MSVGIMKKIGGRYFMKNTLTEKEINLIKENEWVIFGTSDNNLPRCVVVMPSRVEKNQMIISNIQMNKTLNNIRNNNNCFINVYLSQEETQIKITGKAKEFIDGELYNEIKEYEETNNLPDELNVKSIFVIEYKNIEIAQE
jgi:predicted pyridoxine 5'-phosphate oxidase superfamily flavin-nucleotide-binding protein